MEQGVPCKKKINEYGIKKLLRFHNKNNIIK